MNKSPAPIAVAWRLGLGLLLFISSGTAAASGDRAPATVCESDTAALDRTLEAATRLIATAEEGSIARRIPSHVANCFQMACDVRVGIADLRRDRTARRVALVEHIRLLRGRFDKLEALYEQYPHPNEMEPLALVGCRLAQACADLADEMGLPASRLANLKTRVGRADQLADAERNSYSTETLYFARVQLEAQGEPYLARVALARVVRDCAAQRQPWADFQEVADRISRKVSAFHSEEARGGEEENYALARRTLSWIQAERARVLGDRRQELRHRREAVAWSERMAKAYDVVLRDYRYGMTIDCWLAHRDLANDRIDLARLRGDCCAAQRARSKLSNSATELYGYVRNSKRRTDAAYELEYAHCAQTLAEIKCRLHQDIR